MSVPCIACIGIIGKEVSLCPSILFPSPPVPRLPAYPRRPLHISFSRPPRLTQLFLLCFPFRTKQDNPLHISLFPPYTPPQPPTTIPGLNPKPPPSPSASTLLDFSFLLNASLDIFDARSRDRSRIDQDLGLLQHIDERLSIWGHLTATGVKFAIIVDAWGKDGVSAGVKGMLERSGTADSSLSASSSLAGDGRGGGGKKGGKGGGAQVQAQDLKVAFKTLQTAWIRLLGNPFFVLEEGVKGAQGITSKRFVGEVRRVGEGWRPGLTVL